MPYLSEMLAYCLLIMSPGLAVVQLTAGAVPSATIVPSTSAVPLTSRVCVGGRMSPMRRALVAYVMPTTPPKLVHVVGCPDTVGIVEIVPPGKI